ncbi:MAG: hypothetical protein ACOYMA_15725 [Bacteroidia bacterium]
MTPAELYDTKRRNFIEKTFKYFSFLIEEYGYDQPSHIEWKQENGTIIQDKIEYQNLTLKRTISLTNSYHPNDYGFEINFYDPTIPTKYPDKEMVHYVFKEKQDIDQNYLESEAHFLRKNFEKQINGETWFRKK